MGHDGSKQSKGATLSGSKTAYSRWRLQWCNRRGLSEGWSYQTLRKVPEACVWKAEMLHFFLCLCNISHFNNQPVEALKEYTDWVHANKIIWTKFESGFDLLPKLFLMVVLLPNVDLFGSSLKSNPASSRCSVLLFIDSKNGTKRLKNVTCVMLF